MGLQSKLGGALIGSGVLLLTCGALGNQASATSFPRSFNPETDVGYLNTYSTSEALSPQCPEAIADTPGSDPGSKVLNGALNNATSFQPGGTVHFTYLDNPHTNPGTQGFTIQDCVVTYPAAFFSASDFDPTTGVLINDEYTKHELVSGGTQIDGASLSGITSSVSNIHFSWTAPDDIASGTWVCNFARDIANGHGGEGNRKVPPTCYQVPTPPTTTTTLPPTTLPPTTLPPTTLPPTTAPPTTGTVLGTVITRPSATTTTAGARVLGAVFSAPESSPAVAGGSASPGVLPRTGTSPRLLLSIGAAMLCLGVWLSLFSCRKSSRGAPS